MRGKVSLIGSKLALSSIWLMGVMMLASACLLAGCGGKNGNGDLPENFKNLSTEDKMEYLMQNLAPDSVARYISNAALGKIYNSRIELQPAMAYAYEHYDEDQIVIFQEALNAYEAELPLNEKVKYSKLSAVEEADIYSYELGLEYVSQIREERKDATKIKSELDALAKECKTDPDFYKRFMKGFKTALEYDRHHDLDDNIYRQFITYPDSIR